MPILKGRLQRTGALVEGLLGWSAAGAQQQRLLHLPVAPPIQLMALLDTGAEMTCVDAAVIRQLGLPFGGVALANLPAHGGLTFTVLHDASFTILHPSGKSGHHFRVLDVSVLESLAHLGYQALVGRDVLAKCRLLYDGPKNTFGLKY
jgi:hypothetical protein